MDRDSRSTSARAASRCPGRADDRGRDLVNSANAPVIDLTGGVLDNRGVIGGGVHVSGGELIEFRFNRRKRKSPGPAVHFAPGAAARLVIDPGAVFGSTIVANSDDTMELAGNAPAIIGGFGRHDRLRPDRVRRRLAMDARISAADFASIGELSGFAPGDILDIRDQADTTATLGRRRTS